MDPAKLKVVELRAELQARGLDQKGNKPVLVKRLKEALEAELQTELPDTSLADTSTEDCSQDEDCMVDQPIEPAQAESVPVVDTQVSQSNIASEPEPQEPQTLETESVLPSDPEVVEKPATPVEEVEKPATLVEEVKKPATSVEEVKKPEEAEPMVTEEPAKEEQELVSEPTNETQPEITENVNINEEEADKPENVQEEKVEQNGESTNGDTEEDSCEPKAKKSRWGTETEPAALPAATENEAAPVEPEAAPKDQKEERAGKRKHSSPSPERIHRERSKSPIREDEPVVDANKVQLSWYDSDLHLQIDKTNFLSAKPFNDGLFGYIWSGARVTHGVKANKACYEVKITEELKFEDILSSIENRDNRRDKRDNRRDDRARSRAKSENGGERNEKTKTAEKQPEEKEDQTKTESEVKPDEEQVKPEEEKPTENVESATTDAEPMKVDEESIPQIEPSKTEDKKAENEDKTSESEDKKPETEDKKPETEDNQPETEDKKPETEEKKTEPEVVKVAPHLIRIGWSQGKASLQLGEENHSYALESSGKFYTNKTSVVTDATFKVGDVVRALVDMSTYELVFAVNGKVAFKYQIESNDDLPEDFALFPHVLTRNLAFEINTGDREEPLGETPEDCEDYTFVSKLEDLIPGPTTPEKREDCEVIIMCGLPGSGKTYWVKEYLQTASKRYNVLGTSFLMDRMTIDGKPIHSSICSGRMSFFWNKLQKSISRLSEIAPLRRRDFIIDQTNVFPTATRRKLRSFLGFKRHAVVVVNEDEEQEKRLKQQDPEAGKDLSVSSLLEMKANMGLPKVGENLELVTFASLPEDKAVEQVEKYNKQGREGGFGNIGHQRRDYRDDRNNRWANRGSGGGPRREYQHRNNYRDRPYQNNRYDRNYRQGGGGGGGSGGGGGGGNNWRPGGNWMSHNDRRDHRGPRDWRNNNRSGSLNDRPPHRGSGNREHRSHNSSGGGNYNRNRNQSSGGGGSRWGGGGGGSQGSGGGGNWSSGGWNSGQQSQDWNSGWNQSQGSWNQNQWKYGGGYNQGGYSQYPQNWNSYYGGSSNYSQDWSESNTSGHGQVGASAQSTTATTNSNAPYTSSSLMGQQPQQQQQPQQAAWAQYTQQYSQGATNDNSQK